MTPPAYARAESLDDAVERLAEPGAVALAGGTDVAPLLLRGKLTPAILVDIRRVVPDAVEHRDGRLHIGAGATLAEVAAAPLGDGYAALHEAARRAASPQLRAAGTVGGNLAQHVRCWYYRHPHLTCWLNGGDTCYAQIGDSRKHGLEPGDCISVAPSDLAVALLALAAEVEIRGPAGARRIVLAELYGRPSVEHRSALRLEPGELIVEVVVPVAPERSSYQRAGDRAAWSFALVGVAAARIGDRRRLAAIGVTNEPRLLDPDDPLQGLDGLEQTRWKRRLLAELCQRALAAVD